MIEPMRYVPSPALTAALAAYRAAGKALGRAVTDSGSCQQVTGDPREEDGDGRGDPGVTRALREPCQPGPDAAGGGSRARWGKGK